MLKIGTIGIGNAGNQVAQLGLQMKNIPAIALNSSASDLEQIKNADGMMRMVIGDEKGAGKSRDNAKAFLRETIVDFLSATEIINFIAEKDVVFIISSIGGGTGSGMAPIMTDILQSKFPMTKFIIVGIYAPIRESLAAQQNSVDYLKEIRDNNTGATYMAYDNNRFSDLSTADMMIKVNTEIVEDMAVIRGDYQLETPFNSIDEKDMLKIVRTPGRLAVYRISGVKEKDLDEMNFENIFIKKIAKEAAHVELDKDGVVKRLGIITNLTESAESKFDINLKTLKEYVGEPVEGFEHVHRADKGKENEMYLILSGLSIPNDRIGKITERIDEGMKALQEVQKDSVLDSLNTSAIKSLRGDGVENGHDVDDSKLLDLFNKY